MGELDTKVKRKKVAFDPETMGYGKHDYRTIDPSTVNPEDYATNMRGEEEHLGDVREYNSAYNEKHPENDTELDWLGRVGTIFETAAAGLEGIWMVVQMPVVRAPEIWARCARINEDNEPIEGSQAELSTTALGCTVDEKNEFKQIRTKLIKKGQVNRTQRERLTKK